MYLCIFTWVTARRYSEFTDKRVAIELLAIGGKMNQLIPNMKVSDEATKEQLKMAEQQGNVFEEALQHMLEEVASDGQEKLAGPYLVGYAIEKAEGMYHLKDGELVWQAPEKENIHVEITVRDAADGRFIPNLTVHVRLLDSSGNEVGYHQQPFVWHPWLYHYGRNWQIPGDGDYEMHVHIEAPNFPRHDEKNGQRYADDIGVSFGNVEIKTGQA